MSATNKISAHYLIKRLGLFRGLMMQYYFRKGYSHIESFSSWATRWYLSILEHDGLIVCPGVNLALNIGTDGGTHYEKGDRNAYSHLKVGNIEWPISYNDDMIIDKKQKRYDNKDFLHVRFLGLQKKIRKINCKFSTVK